MNRVNLIPEGYLAVRTVRRRLRRWAWALGGAAVLFVLGLAFELHQQSRAKAATLERQRLTAAIDSSRAVLQGLRSAAAQASLRRSRVEGMRTKRRWSALISEVTEAMPLDLRLTSFSSDPATWGQSAPLRGKAATTKHDRGEGTYEVEAARGIILRGVCTDSASPLAFVTNLKARGLFDTISHEHVRRSGSADGEGYEFEIRCGW